MDSQKIRLSASFVGLFLIAAMLFVFACSGSDDAGSNVKKPFGEYTEKTTFVYQRTDKNGTTSKFDANIVGEKTVGGFTYPRYQVGNLTVEDTDMIEIWSKVDTVTKKVTFGGGVIHWKDSGLVPAGEPFVSVETSEPIVLDMESPVGVEQTVQVKGNGVMGDPENPTLESELDFTVTYERENDKATINSNIGQLTDCFVYKGSGSVYEQDLEAEVWYHKEIGAVYININWPKPNGTSFDLLSTSDYGDTSGDSNTIKALSVIDATNPSFKLSTYDVNGKLDADKESHSKMLLEYRWADDERAKTDEEPDVRVEFGTVWGIFPSMVVKSPVSIFHPEENGLGYTYWVSYVDEAAKNEPINGIEYRINVDANTGLSGKVRVTGRIYYKVYKP